ncbi:DUF4197 domain-containing protein [Marinigracilibium pacificum]|uniref:DUF4197 domain-containing protein n=1 Tax=Marinigracilibium pacificum TaxID=2729599 RepID=A0A848J6S6_9BACT|nr:DUF4197 domain-containing protein [Marinigracilibium pacificum]NMM50220.1 DUF4197 domain-containing protein [Marinigracilibium pacificum]
MKKNQIFILLVFLFAACTTSQIQQSMDIVNGAIGGTTGTALSSADVANALKQALEQGTIKGTENASKVDGYFGNPLLKIPFPEEISKAETRLRSVGLNKPVDDFILSMNRAAEKAAIEAKPIFISAIKSMTIQDAWNILKGNDDAATQYLRKTTYSQLVNKFQPPIHNSLKAVNATKYYGDVASTYNKIPLVEPIEVNLDKYVTEKAVDGLFELIKKEEANIRENPVARTTDLMKRVFSQQ